MTSSGAQWSTVGQRVREARLAAGVSVRELARRLGVSASHVSQVERGIGAFSVPALYSVARELQVSMHELLEPPAATTTASRRSAARGPVGEDIVQRAADHPTIQLSAGPRWSRLTPHAETDVEFLEVVYAPGVRAQEHYISHEGREYGLVISGALTVELDGAVTVLHSGDSIVFDSVRPHRFWNDSGEEVRAIWFVRDRPAWDSAPHA